MATRDNAAHGGSRGLHVFGFPVDVRPGFVFLLVLFGVVYSGRGQGELGLWLAVFVAAFTLAHELGHAFAARATGANASIALDFLAGYASFEPVRPLKRWERAGISVAGPAVQIALGSIVVVALGANPLSYDSINDSPATFAAWWAGPIIGLINLIPILPLDGGNIVMSGLDVVLPGRSRTVMLYFSLAVTIGAIVYFTLHGSLSPIFFFFFPLFSQLQMLQYRHAHTAIDKHGSWQLWAAASEREAWTIAKPGTFPPGIVASPYFRAAQLARRGQLDAARDLLLSDFQSDRTPNWMPPDAASPREMAALIELLGTPLPTGNPYAEYVLATQLVRLGEYEPAGLYAASSYGRSPGTMTAVVVAQCAAALGDDELAVSWLRAASAIGTNSAGLLDAIDERIEFATIRHRPDVARLRQDVVASAA
ncbi:MAG TPA: hypothetical protein PLV68_17300 [Ilumatobacteraceae bacterium]|nr:hypothetical protein [Ilumatobacteraceae bacterium]